MKRSAIISQLANMHENAVKLIIWKDEETWETSDLSRCIRGSGISGKTQAKLKAHVNQMFEKIILRAEFQPVHKVA